ncbi:MAG: 4Fe-4S dicluster domain-containing protein [Thermodesulfobacteria bacterium]|nr:4Fe-4S dicluster domain-containing protein [Thermodesulfobacteriota bacterium]
MKIKRKIIHIDEELCNGCGQCVPACEEGAIEIVDGKARLVAEKYCDGLGACLGECPTGALQIVEREAEDFDEEAVHEYLSKKKAGASCPSAQLKNLSQSSCQEVNRPTVLKEKQSLLGHWPIQIRLVPPAAPFLQGSNLLVVADCTAVACPDFHDRFVAGKVIMMGCPKFDDQDAYVERFKEIFMKNNIATLHTVIMEVPCCSAMLGILKKAIKEAGKSMDIGYTVIGLKGAVLSEGKETP